MISLSSIADRRLMPEGRIDGPMPWVIAIMMFLTVLAASAGLALGGAAKSLSASLTGRLSVQIVEANPDVRARQVNAVVADLNRQPNVTDVKPVDEEAMGKLLAPWLGEDRLDPDLPIPALIDLTLKDASPAASSELQARIKRIASSARLDRHADWLGPIAGLLSTLRYVAGSLVALMAVAMAASVVLAARAALDTHRSTIDVMHLMGATDGQIARIFERRVALDALFGAALGFVIGATVIWFVGARFGAVGAALLDAGGLGWVDWLLIVAIPVCGVLLSVATARVTVLRALARIL